MKTNELDIFFKKQGVKQSKEISPANLNKKDRGIFGFLLAYFDIFNKINTQSDAISAYRYLATQLFCYMQKINLETLDITLELINMTDLGDNLITFRVFPIEQEEKEDFVIINTLHPQNIYDNGLDCNLQNLGELSYNIYRKTVELHGIEKIDYQTIQNFQFDAAYIQGIFTLYLNEIITKNINTLFFKFNNNNYGIFCKNEILKTSGDLHEE